MFLTPQHFQAEQQYHEDRTQFRLSASTRVNWGLTDFAIDQEALANGVFTLRLCRGVFPDGMVFHLPDHDPAPEGREFGDHFAPTQQTMDVYLALPEPRPRARNITLQAAEGLAGTRYVAQTHARIDESNGEDEKQIQYCRKNLRLVFEDEVLDGSTAIRIAQVTRSPAGTYVLKNDFVPPCVSLTGSEFLLNLIRRQIELLAAKGASLSSLRRQKGRSLAEFGPGDLGNFWLLNTVNTYMPALKHYWGMRRVHPEAVYLQMLELAGGLSTFAFEEQARDLPAYDHENLGECFQELDARIREWLETAIPSKCVVVPLKEVERRIWVGAIADESYVKKTQFFVAVGAQMGVDEVIGQIPKQVKVSPVTEIQRLIRNALPGLGLRHMPVPPPSVPVRSSRQYFALNQSGILWEGTSGIARTLQIAIFVPDEIKGVELELLILLE
jgi:type VI secretion system protein ImpJ